MFIRSVFKTLDEIEDEALYHNIAKSSILDVEGVFGISESYHPPLVPVQICYPGDIND